MIGSKGSVYFIICACDVLENLLEGHEKKVSLYPSKLLSTSQKKYINYQSISIELTLTGKPPCFLKNERFMAQSIKAQRLENTIVR